MASFLLHYVEFRLGLKRTEEWRTDLLEESAAHRDKGSARNSALNKGLSNKTCELVTSTRSDEDKH
jgi:hypothetical protein